MVIVCVAALSCCVAIAAPAANADDRLDERASELAIEDPYLDPRWPEVESKEYDTETFDSAGSVDVVEKDAAEPEGDELDLTETEREFVDRFMIGGGSLYEALEFLRVEPLEDGGGSLEEPEDSSSEFEDPEEW